MNLETFWAPFATIVAIVIGALAWVFNLASRVGSLETKTDIVMSWLERVEHKIDSALTQVQCPLRPEDKNEK